MIPSEPDPRPKMTGWSKSRVRTANRMVIGREQGRLASAGAPSGRRLLFMRLLLLSLSVAGVLLAGGLAIGSYTRIALCVLGGDVMLLAALLVLL